LPVKRLGVLALGAVNECRVFVVEAVKAVRLLVDKGVVLGHELPTDFRRVDGILRGRHDSGDESDDAPVEIERLAKVKKKNKEKRERKSLKDTATVRCARDDKQESTSEAENYLRQTLGIFRLHTRP